MCRDWRRSWVGVMTCQFMSALDQMIGEIQVGVGREGRGGCIHKTQTVGRAVELPLDAGSMFSDCSGRSAGSCAAVMAGGGRGGAIKKRR